MSNTEAWYVVKQVDGHCKVVPDSDKGVINNESLSSEARSEQWGPFESQGEAIARRVGLIRSGKCQPD
jgi:hypothetical protein